MIQDAQGHNLTGASTEAAAAYEDAIRAVNLVCGDAIGSFDKARAAAPDFVMAHLGKAWLLTMANDPALLVQAAALVETARPLTLNEREQTHLAAVSRQVDGDRDRKSVV